MVFSDLFKAEVKDSLVIDAPKKKVFETLTQPNSYPEWNPYIRRVDGDIKEGEEIRIFCNMGMGPDIPIKCKIENLDAKNGTLSWEYKAPLSWIYSARHSISIEETAPGQCHVVQHEKMQGLLGNRWQWLYKSILKKRFQVMHEALRAQVEKGKEKESA